MRKTVVCAVICLAFGLWHNDITGIGYAADELLAKTELNRSGEKVTAELWATPIKGGYMNDLTVIFKRNDKSLITAYKPTVAGGYNCLLKPINVISKDSDDQLLLSVCQGTWTVPSSFRILDYDKSGKVTEIFGGKENLGIIINAEVKEDTISLSLKNGDYDDVKITKNLSSVEKKRITFDGIYSLVPYDFDNDGVEELFVDQEIRFRRNLLADVGYMLKFDKTKKSWEESIFTIMSNGVENKNDTVNEGCILNGGIFMPRKVVLPLGEGTFPEYAGVGFAAENKVNEILKREYKRYLPEVFAGKEDLAFDVLRADDKLWCVQFISGKTEINHHNVNIDPVSHEVVKLSSIMDTKNKKLLSTLNKLGMSAQNGFNGKISDEWYILKNELYFMQKDSEGIDKTVKFSLEDLKDFIIDEKWLVKKPKEVLKTNEKTSKTEEEKFWDKLIGTDKKEKKDDEKSEKKFEEDLSEDTQSKVNVEKHKKSLKNSSKKEKLTDESVVSEKESKGKKTEEKKL